MAKRWTFTTNDSVTHYQLYGYIKTEAYSEIDLRDVEVVEDEA
jgi:hypothetical protein